MKRTGFVALILVLSIACGGPMEAPAAADLGPSPAPRAAGEAAADEVATDAWDRVLSAYERDGGLDYAGLAADREDLDAYLASLAAARPAGWSKDRQVAFWSNAYNAVVAQFVLERYPGIASVRDVDGFFDALTYPVAGEDRTLDEIEAAAREIDPRVHFTVVCASTSCPDLRGEAYRAEKIEAQLDEQTRLFLADRDKGLRLDGDKLWLSSIFKWYAGDFTGGSRVVAFFSRGGIVEWVLPYLPEELAGQIEKRDPSVSYLDYDWSLNDRK